MIFQWADKLLKDPEQAWKRIDSAEGLIGELAAATITTILCSGLFGMAVGSYVGGAQILITGYKVPLLLLSTFGICVSVMYILNAIVARKLSLIQVVSLGIMSITVTAIILGGFAPIIFLYSRTTTFRYYPHYSFLVLLCTIMVGTAGIVSVWYLSRAFRAMKYSKTTRILVIVTWVLIYQFVGAQMTFVLRPFVGSSSDVVRTEGNFYETVPLLIRNNIINITGGRENDVQRKQ